ncbi:hypothetical protein Droror1_Dr00028028 [Drosera rotundifolia]
MIVTIEVVVKIQWWSRLAVSGNPDIIRESQRRRCANVAIVDEIIALALDLALVLFAVAVTFSASPTTAAAAKMLPTKTTQRGLNKPKCIKCSNVARSRLHFA